MFVASVLEVEKHPNADRLNLCEVDAGGEGQFKWCAARPTSQAGMIAPLGSVGAQLGKEPPLQAAVIRGVRSEGMLCSERELGLSRITRDSRLRSTHHSAATWPIILHLDDVVLDVAITPNRGDCLSILGLAREVAALFGARLHAAASAHRQSAGSPATARRFGPVEIVAPDLCPRYAALR